MARPIPLLSGHWAQMAGTVVWSKDRRASKICRACSSLSPAGPRSITGRAEQRPVNRGRNSSKQMMPSSDWAWAAMYAALFLGSPVTTVTGAFGA